MNIAVINLLRIGDVFQTIPLLLWLKKKYYHTDEIDKSFSLVLVSDNLDVDVISDLSIVNEVIKIDYRQILSSLSSSGIDNLPTFTSTLIDLPKNKFDIVFNLGTNQISCLISDYILSDKLDSKIIGPIYSDKHLYAGDYLTENNLILNNQFKYLFESSINKDLSIINLAEIYLSFAFDSDFKDDNYISLSEFSDFYNSFYNQSLKFLRNNENDYESDFFSDNSNKKTIVINISTGEMIREFDLAFFSQLIFSLVKNDYKIILVGVLGKKSSDHNKDKDLKLLSLLSLEVNKNILNLCNKTNITSLLNIFNQSDLFITPDTGTIHLAASLSKIKILGLYNLSAYHHLTGAYSDRVHFLTPNIQCYPCEESYQVCRDTNNKYGIESLECKKLYSSNNVISCVNYILLNEEVQNLGNLTLSKSSIKDKLLEIEVVFGNEISLEKRIYSIMIKELLFKVDFQINLFELFDSENKTGYFVELIKIYNCSKKENDYSDFNRFVKNNKISKNLDFILELI